MTAKQRRDPDYQLNVFSHYDEESKKEVIVFLVQTTKIFTSFQYDILLEHSLDERVVTIAILGLYVPEILLPHTGPARGRRDLSGLAGSYTIRVVKQDKSVNEFLVDINAQGIVLKTKPADAFILVSTDPAEMG
jgi:hypothetical protein